MVEVFVGLEFWKEDAEGPEDSTCVAEARERWFGLGGALL